MHRLMEALVALQKESNQCCYAVSLPEAATPVSQPAGTNESVPETLYNRNEAAVFLMVDPRSITRYRISGRLRFIYDDNNRIRYREPDLEDCYFWKWGRRP